MGFPDIDAHIVSALSDEVAYTNAPLAEWGEYVSGAIDGLMFRRLTGFVFADQPGTLYVEASRDGVTWRPVFAQTVAAYESHGFDVPFYARYARVHYVNGATAQGAFELAVMRRTL